MRDSILIVGGAGYIGSHTAKLLHLQGYEAVTLDDLSTGHHQAVQFGPLYEGSYSDPELVGKIIARHGIKAVMHFGAKALVGESMRDPLLYYKANVSGTVLLLESMIAAGVKKLIFSSTCAVFGEPDLVPISETAPKKPVNPYGQTKLMVERILADAKQAYGFDSVILRYFNAAGADPEGQLGEDHSPETHLIPRVMQAALGRLSKITIFGNDYPTPDGSCVRDYIHVNDLGLAHIKAMELLRERSDSFDFNLGTGHGYSVLDVIKSVERVTGAKVPFEFGPRRPGDPPKLVGDSASALKILGWKPIHDLDSIVLTAYDFMKAHPIGYSDVVN